MSHTVDVADFSQCGETSELPLAHVDPFTALQYSFGMLLGAADFAAQQAYHLGKMRLHNAWLHGQGVVFGYGVSIDLPSSELRVESGLALDGAGHELFLPGRYCLSLPAWYEAHRNDADVKNAVTISREGRLTLDAHVVARFRPCLTREVPAISEPCEGAGTGTAFSRIAETVELILRPGLAPGWTPPFHRLRLLFGLEPPAEDGAGTVTPSDQDVLDARTAIAAKPHADRDAATLEAFRRFAALDGIDLGPATDPETGDRSRFPVLEPTDVILANVSGITLQPQESTLALVGGTVDATVRRSLLPTATIQELAAGCPCGDFDRAAPRIEAAEIVEPVTIRLTSDTELHAGTVVPDAFSVSTLPPAAVGGGWTEHDVNPALDGSRKVITLTVNPEIPADHFSRIVARGSGPTPITDDDARPIDDFVATLKRTAP